MPAGRRPTVHPALRAGWASCVPLHRCPDGEPRFREGPGFMQSHSEAGAQTLLCCTFPCPRQHTHPGEGTSAAWCTGRTSGMPVGLWQFPASPPMWVTRNPAPGTAWFPSKSQWCHQLPSPWVPFRQQQLLPSCTTPAGRPSHSLPARVTASVLTFSSPLSRRPQPIQICVSSIPYSPGLWDELLWEVSRVLAPRALVLPRSGNLVTGAPQASGPWFVPC